MADWESRAKRGMKSASQQSNAELLRAIAARRQAQLLRNNKAPSPPPGMNADEVPTEKAEHVHAEVRLAASKILPESSEASGASSDDDGSFDSTSLPGEGGRCKESTPKDKSEGSSMDDLRTVLDQMSIKDKNGAQSSDRPGILEKQSERKPRDLILNIRKRLVKKSTIVDSDNESESESFDGVDPVSSPSIDYNSADDGDVDSPVVSKVKSKIKPAGVAPRRYPSVDTRPSSSPNADVEHVRAPGFRSVAKGFTETTLNTVDSPPPSAAVGNLINESDVPEKQQELVLSDGKHRFCLRPKTANMLYPHQRSGIEWLWSLHMKGMGGILGDDMGLGKTMQVAAFLAGLFCTQNIKCALIVAPKTLIAHWVKELKVVGLSRKTYDYSGTSVKAREYALQNVLQMGGVLLTTYDMVRCNFKALRGDFDGRDGYGDTSDDIITWDYMILDEGHLVKNPNTQRAKSLREIPAAHRIVISGTPIQNHLQEMWALFDFCCPDLLGDRKEFKDKYERQILAGTDKNASDRQKRIGIQVAEELRQKFGPFFLRRLKSEVFPDSEDKKERKLSRKNDLIVWLPLSEGQEKLYRAFLNSNTAEETLSTGTKVLSALTVMKKICDHPMLLTKRAANDIAEGMEGYLDAEDIQAAEAMTHSLAGMVQDDEDMSATSCKIDFLMALLDNLVAEGHRTLIFAQTRKMLNIIQDEILERGWIFRRIDGTIKAADRELCVQEFQSDDEIPLFLLTSQVGGLGLTLTGADRVVIVDPAWNPSTDNQSVDRAYRIGQKNDVVIYRLMTCGTIEEKIYRKQVFKGHLMKVATEKKNQMRYFSQGELGEMFKVPEVGFRVSETQLQLHKEHSSQHKIDEGLQKHIEFLDGLGIAGVSHHDLLFTKEAEPLPPPGSEDQDLNATWEPRNPSYVGHRYKAASKPEKYSWEASQAVGRGILATATAGLQSQGVDNSNALKVEFLRGKLERLSRTLDDKAMIARLPDHGVGLEKKLKETQKELREAELIAGSKENIGAHLPSRSAAQVPGADLSADETYAVTNIAEGQSAQRPKPLGFNNNQLTVPTLVSKKNSCFQETVPATQTASVPGVQRGVHLPSWSLLSDSPTSSRGSPAPTSREDVDDMAEALSSLRLRLH
ncbi:SNF2 domain-containing protein ENL1 isoform X1 [Physcomitrium patens]|uniref:SNF2 domain-containing protein ENL1 isoform X1 n=1 Tax=Physcomitrium patens TaxID=3218 RepID=UPI000D161EC9|nr:protein CHROMATIN REMODELING 24-like isoform X1 [Physcomitrium patens]|eukprot:XP_024394535.1 protein CHROMATIN REMODELING 24-like isoform X1 [Physcomitrella patens]